MLLSMVSVEAPPMDSFDAAPFLAHSATNLVLGHASLPAAAPPSTSMCISSSASKGGPSPSADGSAAAGSSSGSGSGSGSASPGLRIFEELQRLVAEAEQGGGFTPAPSMSVNDLSSREIEEIRQLKKPPAVVRRTLEAVWLLLNATRSPSRPQAPSWERVQRMLSDIGFLARLLRFDFETLRQAPAVTTYVALEYFSRFPGGTSTQKRRPQLGNCRLSMCRSSPKVLEQGQHKSLPNLMAALPSENEQLSYARVLRANRAAAALFRWTSTVLLQVFDPDPTPVKVPEVAALTDSLEEEEDQTQKEMEPPVLIEVIEELPQEQRNREEVVLPAIAAPVAAAPQSPKEAEGSPRKSAVSFLPALKAGRAPDRHFELFVPFDLGSSSLELRGEQPLQTLAASLVMRRRLRLSIVGAPDPLENAALAKHRLAVVQDWLLSQGIPDDSMEISSDHCSPEDEPGVLCQLLLDRDNPLRDYFLLAAQGEVPEKSGSQETQDFVRCLEEDFICVKHR